MKKIFYIADTHFGHQNCISFDNRPFVNVKDMEETIINNWNEVVDDCDDVYILGDMFWNYKWGEANELACRLRGNLHNIVGNHDDRTIFPENGEYMQIEDNSRHVILCHYPIMFYKNMTKNDWYHLYGHVHAAWDHNMTESWRKQIEALYQVEWKGYNVGCMLPYMNYTPRTLDEIVTGARAMRRIERHHTQYIRAVLIQ